MVPGRGSPADWTFSDGGVGSADGPVAHLETNRFFILFVYRMFQDFP